MPRATVSQDTERCNLVTCEGGYVDLRTLSFHEMNTRADIATRMYQEQTAQPRSKGGRRSQQSEPDVVRGYFEIMNVAVTEFEFRNCIVDHNLEDENGNLIDFTRPMQAWRLDPKIGQEISALIDARNQMDEDVDLTPLATVPSPFSSAETSGPESPSPSES